MRRCRAPAAGPAAREQRTPPRKRCSGEPVDTVVKRAPTLADYAPVDVRTLEADGARVHRREHAMVLLSDNGNEVIRIILHRCESLRLRDGDSFGVKKCEIATLTDAKTLGVRARLRA
jgi:hypothetical protein